MHRVVDNMDLGGVVLGGRSNVKYLLRLIRQGSTETSQARPCPAILGVRTASIETGHRLGSRL
jgi:hypothetical protein